MVGELLSCRRIRDARGAWLQVFVPDRSWKPTICKHLEQMNSSDCFGTTGSVSFSPDRSALFVRGRQEHRPTDP